jgi:hypothetical protein
MFPIRRFILVNATACCLFMLLWASIGIIEVKVKKFEGLQPLYVLSLLLCLLGMPALNWAAFRGYPGKMQLGAAVCAGAFALVFIYACIVGMLGLKVALGGGK